MKSEANQLQPAEKNPASWFLIPTKVVSMMLLNYCSWLRRISIKQKALFALDIMFLHFLFP